MQKSTTRKQLIGGMVLVSHQICGTPVLFIDGVPLLLVHHYYVFTGGVPRTWYATSNLV
jgi:hypothetical protein